MHFSALYRTGSAHLLKAPLLHSCSNALERFTNFQQVRARSVRTAPTQRSAGMIGCELHNITCGNEHTARAPSIEARISHVRTTL